ncbi:MAG: cytochrome P450 [Nitratireductor sp.]
MSKAPPIVDIDPKAFWTDPYPALARMRRDTPVCFVPQLNAVLMTRRDDIYTCEKNIEIFSSRQPQGLMTRLMGENMMRKDGEDHMRERRQVFPAISPRTVRDHWRSLFEADTDTVIAGLDTSSPFDLVRDFAMPVSGNALRHITGLVQITADQMDWASQAMIDGVGNYAGDRDIEARCHEATGFLDQAIDEVLSGQVKAAQTSMIAVLDAAGQPVENIRANVKLAISGGQNEPRDAIAGCVYALLAHPAELEKLHSGKATWLQVFEEYSRWISPIGMSPREIRQDFEWGGFRLAKGQRIFLMFGSANRDETHFENPENFDISRDTSKAISFGAGPHFCAGAAASRTLISEVALPRLFAAFPEMQLAGDVPFGGWAFRGPLKVPVRLSV